MSPVQQSQPSGVGEVLEYLSRLPQPEQPMQGLLQGVTDLAKAVLPGNCEASVTLWVKDRPSTVAATGQLAVDLDEDQYERGYGPCLHATETREIAEIPDTRSDHRWPDFAQHAAEHGALSSLSVPLAIDAPQLSGALNIYARQPNAFNWTARSAATRLASYAAVVAKNLLLYQRALQRVADLEAALASRAVIEQAKGILMERHKVTANGAFHVLARASRRAHMRVRYLAEQLVRTGELRR